LESKRYDWYQTLVARFQLGGLEICQILQYGTGKLLAISVEETDFFTPAQEFYKNIALAFKFGRGQFLITIPLMQL
jgi:hypothetical protein